MRSCAKRRGIWRGRFWRAPSPEAGSCSGQAIKSRTSCKKGGMSQATSRDALGSTVTCLSSATCPTSHRRSLSCWRSISLIVTPCHRRLARHKVAKTSFRQLFSVKNLGMVRVWSQRGIVGRLLPARMSVFGACRPAKIPKRSAFDRVPPLCYNPS